jgi:hypothetical protein
VKTEIALDRQAKGAERAAITLEGLIEKASQILDLAIAESNSVRRSRHFRGWYALRLAH